MTEPDWVVWARRLTAIAQNGLWFATDRYDRDRYLQVQQIAAAMIAAGSAAEPSAILELLAADDGYATPKVDVRGVCFDDSERVLLVLEREDGLWTLPGGWADPTDLPSAAVEREVAEEAGYQVRAARLLACWDRTLQQDAQPYPWRVYKLFFDCEVLGETPRSHDETSDVGWFGSDDLPPLSPGRVTADQIRRLAVLHRDPALPAAFH